MSFRDAGRELLAMDRSGLALRLLLVDLRFAPAITGCGRRSSAWPRSVCWCRARCAALRIALDWPMPDEHAYLLASWWLAAALASASANRAGAPARNGRALIGLTFLLATLWKVALSPDFLDGRFFAVTLVDDRRVEDFTRLASGLDEDAFWDLRELVREHSDGVFVPWQVMPEQTSRFRALLAAMTVSNEQAGRSSADSYPLWQDPPESGLQASRVPPLPAPESGREERTSGSRARATAWSALEPLAVRFSHRPGRPPGPRQVRPISQAGPA